MASVQSKGNCYICGKELSKSGMSRHLATHEEKTDNSQKCIVLKVEGRYDKSYWLYLDMKSTADLGDLDDFLRLIWLECCGHMSAFFEDRYDEISMKRKVSTFSYGRKISYQYDFGSTTELEITFVREAYRPKQKEPVRLLARNEAHDFRCCECGGKATEICLECMYEGCSVGPFFCEKCYEKHQEEHNDYGSMPVTNSPRMGVCGYDGELDVFEFDPKKITYKK